MNALARLSFASIEAATAVVMDVDRNVIWIQYIGHVTARSTKRCRETVVAALASLLPGFTVITDLSNLESMDIECVDDLAGMMDAFRVSGAQCVIRVVPDREKDIGFNILSIVHYRGLVRVVIVESVLAAADTLTRLRGFVPAAKLFAA